MAHEYTAEVVWTRDGAAFTVETFARYLTHDPVHHLYDVTGQRAPAVEGR